MEEDTSGEKTLKLSQREGFSSVSGAGDDDIIVAEAYKIKGRMRREEETRLILVLTDVGKESLIGTVWLS